MNPFRTSTAIMLIGILFPGCMPAGFDCHPASGIVTAVLDGDTIMMNNTTVVRLMGIDAPETGDCFSARATATATALLLGADVQLLFAGECLDDYGRTVAHVIVDGLPASEILAAEGCACAWNLEPEDPLAGRIRKAARNAAATGSGLWGACADVPCRSR